MSRSFSFTRLLHQAYPAFVLALSLTAWANRVHGNEKRLSFLPQTQARNPFDLKSTYSCSLKPDLFSMFKADTCSIGEQEYFSSTEPLLMERKPSSRLGDFAFKN